MNVFVAKVLDESTFCGPEEFTLIFSYEPTEEDVIREYAKMLDLDDEDVAEIRDDLAWQTFSAPIIN
jgi:hypothetical protein